ncbi:hypothetical protein CCMSSC00406_0008309 [Pleurotus cornucopiae]|uniref:Uncharacterized protein n=1 Tax=Pleurotus cornucopiae TaxID=5321 RepID=A0ACB7ITI9_PLECO|nr:hypothetical protein CCMSSC00406_0008309 [Pleurotus cornucopiae]
MPPFYVQTPPPRITAEMSFRVSSISLPTIAADMEFGSGPIASHNIIPAAARPDSSDDEDGPPLGSSANTRIPKPAGEPGRRPETGGFPLKERLLQTEKWQEVTYDEILSAVRKAAGVTLKVSKSYKFQDKSKVDLLCQKIARKWTFLDEYEDHWPVKSMLKIYLKYTSERSRKDNKDAAEELEKI